MWSVALWDHPNLPLQWGVVLGASLAGAVSDLIARRVPNRLTGPVLLGGLVAAPAIGGLPGLADAIAGCLLLALPYVLLFVFFGGGAGDAKLMGAIGTWLGVVNGIAVLISVLLSGAVIAIGFALAKKQFGHVLANVVRIVSTTAFFFAVDRRAMLSQTTGSLPGTQDMQTIPYGIAIFVGTCIAAAGVLLWRA